MRGPGGDGGHPEGRSRSSRGPDVIVPRGGCHPPSGRSRTSRGMGLILRGRKVVRPRPAWSSPGRARIVRGDGRLPPRGGARSSLGVVVFHARLQPCCLPGNRHPLRASSASRLLTVEKEHSMRRTVRGTAEPASAWLPEEVISHSRTTTENKTTGATYSGVRGSEPSTPEHAPGARGTSTSRRRWQAFLQAMFDGERRVRRQPGPAGSTRCQGRHVYVTAETDHRARRHQGPGHGAVQRGPNADQVLADSGYAPRKKPTETVQQKAAAVAQAKATRVARGTTGPKARAKIRESSLPRPAPTPRRRSTRRLPPRRHLRPHRPSATRRATARRARLPAP